MMPVSHVNTGAVRPLTAAGEAPGVSKVREPKEPVQQRKPVLDEYVPEEPREPYGRYWPGRDADGQPKIFFDDPERAAGASQPPEPVPEAGQPDAPRADGPEKKDGEDEENCVCDTGKVDREIERLKKQRQELEQRLNTETDERRAKDLERRLSQIEQELQQKDNDAYRRQHADFTNLS